MAGDNNYVSNKELLEELTKFKATCRYDVDGKYIVGSGKLSDKLGKMLLLIAHGLSSKPNFNGYTWKEDMIGEGLLVICKYLHNFNPEKSSNAFAYVTQYFYNAFIAYITKQKKHSYIKDQLFIRSGIEDELGIDYEQYKQNVELEQWKE